MTRRDEKQVWERTDPSKPAGKPKGADAERIRDLICKPVADALKAFAGFDADLVGQALMTCAMLDGPEDGVPRADIEQITRWGDKIHTDVVALQFVLTGVSALTVQDGNLMIGIPDPAALVRHGFGKPVQEPPRA